MNARKVFADNDVLETALLLINMNGLTTTLEVKEKLRDLGFWATQNGVSASMDQLAGDSKLHFTDGFPYRTYVLPQQGGFLTKVTDWFDTLLARITR